MALFIEKLHNIVADLAGKNVATWRPPEFTDRILNLVLVETFNEYLDHYVKTKKISDYLLQFKRQKPLSLTSGVVSLPGDVRHVRAVYNATTGKEIDLVEDKFWNRRVNRKFAGPSTNPICRIEYSVGDNPVPQLQVVGPVTQVNLFYFKTPRDVKYGYNPDGPRYVYDESSSVDLEFPIGLYPDIVLRMLDKLGVVLREGQLTQVVEILKQQKQLK